MKVQCHLACDAPVLPLSLAAKAKLLTVAKIFDFLLPFWPHIQLWPPHHSWNSLSMSPTSSPFTCRFSFLEHSLPPLHFHLVCFFVFFIYNEWYLPSNSQCRNVLENSENLVLDVWPSLDHKTMDSWLRIFQLKTSSATLNFI